MSNKASREHHWWPVGLQTYWTDQNGEVSWIDPEGRIDKKKAKKRKIAYKSHGHTIFKGEVWETNFEDDFSNVDNNVHSIIKEVSKLIQTEFGIHDTLGMIKLLFKRDRKLRDMCNLHKIDENTHRILLLLLYSILIRSPGGRFKYESFSRLINRHPDEAVGKANMRQSYLIAKNLCEKGSTSNQFFVILHSRSKRFVFGDGSLDWLSGSLAANRVDGKALVPLTPNICVYVCTPRIMRTSVNCASLNAAPWMVDWINDIAQIYACEKLFFLGKPPIVKDAFRRRQFLEHRRKSDALIDMLDEIAGIEKQSRFVAFTASI